MSRGSFAMVVLLVLAGAVALTVHYVRIPPHWNPWSPLQLDQEPNFLTRYKLARTSDDAQLCRSLLSSAGWQYTPIDDEVTRPGCGYSNAVRIQRMNMSISEPFALSCRAALSLAFWERHALQPAAQRHFQAPVTRIDHFGSYACRTVSGRPSARMSHHATADALDVAGFVIGDDTRIRVVNDWDNEGPAGQFLREVRDRACPFFDSVLGPDYNAAHRDHFHLDRGPFRLCR